MSTSSPSDKPTSIEIAAELSKALSSFHVGEPVTHIYNPFEYAWDAVELYLERFGSSPREVFMLGMNPGPWGMAQTGIPFGDVSKVRDWMGISAEIGKPASENPKRLITGFDCPRSEVSGTRLYDWAEQRYETAEKFFEKYFIWNYCPLSFMEAGGRNFIPEKLSKEEREKLFAPCDIALKKMIEALEPKYLVGIGNFAEKQLRKVVGKDFDGVIGKVLHPSPASPKANRGWAEYAEQDLTSLGIEL